MMGRVRMSFFLTVIVRAVDHTFLSASVWFECLMRSYVFLSEDLFSSFSKPGFDLMCLLIDLKD
jgi:hypothetical protein